MKINLFGLGNKKKYKEIERVFYQLWCMHQKGAILPKFLDLDFKAAYNRMKKKYTYNELVEKLGI